MLVSMAYMFGGQGIVGTSKRETPKVDLVDEFRLIEEKKSNLSRKDRDWVVSQFKRNYEKL